MKKSMKLYNFITTTFSGILKLVFRVKIVGAENENYDGTVLVCSNHMSNWDPVILACMLKTPVRFMSKAELFKIPVLKSALKALGAFPINRGSNDLVAIKMTLEMLKSGNNVCLFPQGQRYEGINPRGTEIKAGIGMLLNHSKVAVLPVAIYTKDFKVKMFKKTYVVVGKVQSFESFGMQDNNREEYQRVSKDIFESICKLVDEAENGSYDK